MMNAKQIKDNPAPEADVKPLTAALSRLLAPQGITVKLNCRQNCLHILLESDEVPPAASVSLISPEINRLHPPTLRLAKIYGRQKGQTAPAWSQLLPLTPTPVAKVSPQPPSLQQLARQGDVTALNTLINRALAHKQITAKVKLLDNSLAINLSSDPAPDEKVAVTLICRELVQLKIAVTTPINITGQKTDDTEPAWDRTIAPSELAALTQLELPKPPAAVTTTKSHQGKKGKGAKNPETDITLTGENAEAAAMMVMMTQPRPRSYLILSILVAAFGFQPLGFLAVQQSWTVIQKCREGNYSAARAASMVAKFSGILGGIVGVIFYISTYQVMHAKAHNGATPSIESTFKQIQQAPENMTIPSELLK
ncbi:CD225/dispanin family protein [[Phormidium] sp. ETS-05]|uniref:CD225/dispanin family protein n=1 Tax=[Phormidium] sp. ETS-05 TaxID=222819 RepID=UPI0018EF31D0|nr:CD225/dispanin family protein [[Phormidium] sp. ETS-05]